MTVKRSVVLNGHRTSVSIEEPFWKALTSQARADGCSLNETIAAIDAVRGSANLSSAIRVHVLTRLQSELERRSGE